MTDRPPSPPFEIRELPTGRGLFALLDLPSGTRLFGEDEWSDDEVERASYVDLSPRQVAALREPERGVFLRFAYHSARDRIRGTFRPEAVSHPSNFMNHSCAPNAGYDGGDGIVTLKAVPAGGELTMDYGTFTFAYDHGFVCRCGSPQCRGKVTRTDWKALVRAGLHLPGFMASEAERLRRSKAIPRRAG